MEVLLSTLRFFTQTDRDENPGLLYLLRFERVDNLGAYHGGDFFLLPLDIERDYRPLLAERFVRAHRDRLRALGGCLSGDSTIPPTIRIVSEMAGFVNYPIRLFLAPARKKWRS